MRMLVLAALPLLLAGPAAACAAHEASRAPTVLADNAATSTPSSPNGKTDTVAFPNSPNGSPTATNKGAPVPTDKAACAGAGPTATCEDSPKPSGAADTSDVTKTTPTTVDGTAPKPQP